MVHINDDINRIRNLFLYHFMLYHTHKIDVDELCKRLKRLDQFYDRID